MSSPWLFGTTPTRYFLQFFEFKRSRCLVLAQVANFLDKMPQEGFKRLLKARQKFVTPRSSDNDSRVSTDAPLSNSSPSNNSFDMQKIAASLEDKLTIKMNKMLNEMKALVVWICQILQEISQKRTRERMSDQEAKEIKAEAREIMPQPSTVNCS
ncbi:hypothetical protein Tco_1506233 [Tanacetum coccineum]